MLFLLILLFGSLSVGHRREKMCSGNNQVEGQKYDYTFICVVAAQTPQEILFSFLVGL